MSITRDIFSKLNESAEVKKTYGDKPQEGKKEPIQKGRGSKVPSGKANNNVKAEKLPNNNSQAADIYTNDTDKLMDKIDSKEQSDKGKVAKTTGKKSDKSIKFPFGDKVQQSDSKLIKEGDEVLKEGNGAWIQIQNDVIRGIENAMMELENAYPEDKEEIVSEFLTGLCGIIKEIAEEHGYYVDLTEGCKKEDK